MAFTFIAEDGTGKSDATSYASVEQADAICARNIHEEEWFALTTDQKEKVLSQATALLDTYARWDGRAAVQTSALLWPRFGATDRDGAPLPADELPRDLIEGTVELARFICRDDRTLEQDQARLRSLKADVVELKFRDIPRPVVPHYIWRILAILTPDPTKSKKIVR